MSDGEIQLLWEKLPLAVISQLRALYRSISVLRHLVRGSKSQTSFHAVL